MAKKLTTEEFITKAKLVHGDKYDYSLVIYNGVDSKIKIVCPIHGLFYQTPYNHCKGHECKKCSFMGMGLLTNEEFIEKAKLIHGDKYNYSKVKYKTAKINVIIICPIHGEFKQIPDSHLRGSDCIKCSIITNTVNQRDTKKDFIIKSKLIHGDKYDYSKVSYINSKTNVELVCPKHGSWFQLPYNHLMGKGCFSCVELFNSKGEKEVKKYLNKHNIIFKRQKTFDDCKNPETNRKLKFDFYLPDYNICIEYDGRQHFVGVNKWWG